MESMYSRIYLASTSPRRSELLRQIGVAFDVLTFRGGARGNDADVDETPFPDESIDHYVERLALVKAAAGWRRLYWRKWPHFPVLAADTALELDGEILGKPADIDDAVAMLRRLSGRTHSVFSGVAVCDGKKIRSSLSRSDVRLRALNEDELLRYVNLGEGLDKAGGYAIQGRAALFIEEIRGSYSGIMGLPLMETGQLLQGFNYQF